MALCYSLGVRLSKPNDKNSEKKVYATLQMRELVDIDALAEHMASHNSQFSKGVIKGIVEDTVSCVVEMLKDGNHVELGPLGTLRLTCKSEGVDDASTFNPASNMVRINLRLKPNATTLARIRNGVAYEYVSTRKQQAAARKQEKQALNVKIGASAPAGEGGGEG